MSAQEAPLILCRICSAWRIAALSMPRLWASLHIPTEFIVAKPNIRRPAVEQWLTRAAASALHLSLCDMLTPWQEPMPSTDQVAALFESVAKFSSGWQNLECTWITDVTARALAGIHTPRLESFTFTAGELTYLSHFGQLLNSPRLRAVSLSSSELPFVPTLPIAWHQLTTLVVQCPRDGPSSSISLRDIISLLQKCPQLVSFQVTPTLNDPPFDYQSLSVTMSFLEEFSVVPPHLLSPKWYLACIIHCVSMPKLRRMHFPLVENVGSESDKFSLASVGEKYPLIEDLAMHSGPPNSPAPLNVLHSFPALTRLVVNAYHIIPEENDAWGSIWESQRNLCGTARLIETLLDTTVCPRLQELEIMEARNLDKHILVTFLSARLQGGSACQLRSLSISFQTAWGEPMIPYLSPTESEHYGSLGLTISFFPRILQKPQYARFSSPWLGLPP
ncbi:hypothetical protein R3P38DRAFT_1949872 [Favolaschia claudopus]|uniref:F-box domain-containing protein n=1 Tax=Favolaschia claudopus TaxID=2862362 RepID=A0AAW0A162_9AGAR